MKSSTIFLAKLGMTIRINVIYYYFINVIFDKYVRYVHRLFGRNVTVYSMVILRAPLIWLFTKLLFINYLFLAFLTVFLTGYLIVLSIFFFALFFLTCLEINQMSHKVATLVPFYSLLMLMMFILFLFIREFNVMLTSRNFFAQYLASMIAIC